METYSRGENLKFFGVPENTECVMEEESQQGARLRTLEKLCTNSWKRNFRLNNPARKYIELQRIHHLGKPDSSKPYPIITRFLELL